MADAYFTIDNPQTTGHRKNAQMIGPNLCRYTGTWVANGTDTSITIDLTDATKPSTGTLGKVAVLIDAFGVHVDGGTVTELLTCKPNVNKAGASNPGMIGILVCATDNTGTWWADVVI